MNQPLPVWMLIIMNMAFWLMFGATLYIVGVRLWDWWMLKPRRKMDPNWQFHAGLLPSSEARDRLRTELKNGDVVYYNRCKYCRLVVAEGTSQLEAWQAYSRHVAERHQ